MPAQHTPGTWTVEKWPTKYHDLYTYNIVAEVDPETDPYHVTRYGVAGELDSEADASLIAAAPELLEALDEMTEWSDKLGQISKNCGALNPGVALYPALKRARAAIARATGEVQ